MICASCGNRPQRSIEEYRYRESGLDNVYVTGVGIFRCQCGQEYIQLPGAQEVHDEIASRLLKKSSSLTGSEARFLRKWLRLTSDEMARALGYTRVTVSRWENQGLSVATDRALRLYAAAVRGMPLEIQSLFDSITPRPERNFKITVDGLSKLHESLATAYQVAAAIALNKTALQEPTTNFRTVDVKNATRWREDQDTSELALVA